MHLGAGFVQHADGQPRILNAALVAKPLRKVLAVRDRRTWRRKIQPVTIDIPKALDADARLP